jgi:peptidoglycan L-alanyl-D-glutamate endopeptidase CwlK
LDTCDSVLIEICEAVIKDYDFTVLSGFRSEAEQQEAYDTGHSNLVFPNSKHNVRLVKPEEFDSTPCSQAVDIAPWHAKRPHIRWDNEREFVFLAGLMTQAANERGIRLRWGGNWDQDMDLYDVNKPFDLVHFGLV